VAGVVGHLSFGVAAGVALVLVIVLVLAVITDLSCYFVNGCGITMCICRSLGRSPGPISGSQSKEKAMEEGERSVNDSLQCHYTSRPINVRLKGRKIASSVISIFVY